MTGSELKEYTEQLIGGETLGETKFYNLLNTVRKRIEGARNWQVLLKEDTSQTASSGDDHETAKSLPSDFNYLARRTERQPQMLLIRNNTELEYKATAFANRYPKKDTSGLFVVDMANTKFYLLGNVDQSYTIHLFYIYDPADIESGTEWVFPSKWHDILAYEVAYLQAGGVDYDKINKLSAPVFSEEARSIYYQMKLWDSKLQLSNIQDQ